MGEAPPFLAPAFDKYVQPEQVSRRFIGRLARSALDPYRTTVEIAMSRMSGSRTTLVFSTRK
jgi:hypothetical protein